MLPCHVHCPGNHASTSQMIGGLLSAAHDTTYRSRYKVCTVVSKTAHKNTRSYVYADLPLSRYHCVEFMATSPIASLTLSQLYC